MKRSWMAIILLSLFFACQAFAAPKAAVAPSAKDKCPVCGMFVAKYPIWTGSIVFSDGNTVYFDGPKDLFTYVLFPEKYDPGRKRSDIAEIYVKDYYSLAPVDGRKAYYVIGSNVYGPMGKELIPFADKADADGFLHDHAGKQVLRFEEITRAILKKLE